MFNEVATSNVYESSPSHLCADELLSSSMLTSTNILDSIAPIKARRIKPKLEPWLNDATRALRRLCRPAERKWKKNKLQVFSWHLQGPVIKISENG